MEDVKTIHICYGLPGSGKTFFCSNEMKRFDRIRGKQCYVKKCYVDLDSFFKEVDFNSGTKDVTKKLKNMIKEKLAASFDEYFFDGLITTEKALQTIINVIDSCNDTPYLVIIDYWEEDRETCKMNDFKRRNVSSKRTIDAIPFDKIFREGQIRELVSKEQDEKFSFKICYHTVVLKPSYKMWFAANNLYLDESPTSSLFGKVSFKDSKYLYSSTWCGGGTYWGYDGKTSPISAEEPVEFTEFYDLLEQLNPDMSFLLFRKIEKNCVSIEEINNADYYSDAKDFRYKLDLEEMFYLIDEWEENHPKSNP